MACRGEGTEHQSGLSRTFTFSSSRSITDTHLTHGARRNFRDGIRAYWDATMQMGTLRGELASFAWRGTVATRPKATDHR
jgi:hypothetical protein